MGDEGLIECGDEVDAVAEHSTYFVDSTLYTSTFAILFIVQASVNTTMYSVNVIIQFLHHTW